MRDLVERLLVALKTQRGHLAIIGDAMVDRWVHGRLAECQDGCPKFMQEEVVEVPGGAGNAERCLKHWGVRTWLFGQVRSECPVKTRYVQDGTIVFRADHDGPRPSGLSYQWSCDLALEVVGFASGVLLSDYDKGFLTPELIKEVVALCRRRGVPCVADAKRAPELYAGCIVKGNHSWFSSFSGVPDSVVITKGKDTPWCRYDGITSVFNEEVIKNWGLFYRPVKCINHVGAGDCFAAHLTLALSCGFSLFEAAALAHSAGRVYVQYPHNEPPTPAVIKSDLSAG